MPSLFNNIENLLTSQIPYLTILFIVSFPKPRFLHQTGSPHIAFPPYSKAEALRILSQHPPALSPPSSPSSCARQTKETREIWTRFASAVWDTLARHSGRSLPAFRTLCTRLWPAFTAPLLTTPPTFAPHEFSKLLVAQRSLFQNEATLIPTITPQPPVRQRSLAIQLPFFSKLLLVAAYLASYNPSRTDLLHFSTTTTSKRKKKGGGTAKTRRGAPGTTRHRKIERRLLGPQAFVMERCMAIFHALCMEARGVARGGCADVLGAMKTLESLRLVGKTAASADELEGGTKWRVCVGWEVVRGVARGCGVEVEDFVE